MPKTKKTKTTKKKVVSKAKPKKANASSPSKAAKKVAPKPAPKAAKPVVKAVPFVANKPFEQDVKANASSSGKKPSLIEAPEMIEDDFDHEPVFETIEQVPFFAVVDVFHAMREAFTVYSDHKPSERFFAAWHAFLAISGWNEDSFFEAYELDDPCPTCGGDMGDDEDETLPALKPAPDKLAN